MGNAVRFGIGPSNPGQLGELGLKPFKQYDGPDTHPVSLAMTGAADAGVLVVREGAWLSGSVAAGEKKDPPPATMSWSSLPATSGSRPRSWRPWPTPRPGANGPRGPAG